MNNIQNDQTQQADEQPFVLDVVLASASPRRKELLEREGVNFTIRVSHVDETIDENSYLEPKEAAKKIAERKAHAVVEEMLGENYRGTAMVIGADTMVVYNNEIFGKPENKQDAHNMLRKLSGNTHEVITGVSVWMILAEGEDISIGMRSFTESSGVIFKQLSDETIDAYIEENQPFDKAGSYGIQDEGISVIEGYEGDFDNVVGLPVLSLIEKFPQLVGKF